MDADRSGESRGQSGQKKQGTEKQRTEKQRPEEHRPDLEPQRTRRTQRKPDRPAQGVSVVLCVLRDLCGQKISVFFIFSSGGSGARLPTIQRLRARSPLLPQRILEELWYFEN